MKAKLEPSGLGSLWAAKAPKLTVVNGAKGARIAKMCRHCGKAAKTCKCKAVKSDAQPRTIVPVPKLKWGNAPMLKARNVTTLGVLSKKLPYSANPVSAPTHGSSPRWETPPIPDYADIYFQPESDKRNKLEREHQANRRYANAKRNKGIFGFHGDAASGEPALRYDPEETLSQPFDLVDPKRPGKRKPKLVVPKVMDRLKAGQTKQQSTYGSDNDEDDDDDKKKKRKKRKLVARRK